MVTAAGQNGATVFDAVAIQGTLQLGTHATDTARIYTPALTANATNNVTISNVAPAGVGTATISAWLPINVNGTTYYIPCWT